MAIFGKGRPASGRTSPAAPLPSPTAETLPMWNILPSYQLYESTFSKAVMPTADDYQADGEPPTYAASSPPYELPNSPYNSANSDHNAHPNAHPNSHLNSHPNSNPNSHPTSPAPEDYFSARPRPRWENSILAHVHRMKQLSAVHAEAAAQLQVKVELTAARGEGGVAPLVYDGESREFRQGDQIHGYVIVRNMLTVPLPFSMCSVVFEGKISVVGWDDRPPLVYKFLNMFDYTASWTPAWFDEAKPEVDEVDGTRLAFPVDKRFAPGVGYKKFFSFTVPERLLDCCCEQHGHDTHCAVPPSLGVNKEMFLQRMRRARSAHWQPPLRIRDYGFSDTSLSYCVEARVVGKLSDYGGNSDEFVIVSNASAPVRVVPKARAPPEESVRTSAAYYATLVREVERGLADAAGHSDSSTGRSTTGATGGTGATGRRLSTVKHSQLYSLPSTSPVPEHVSTDSFRVTLSYKKRSLTQPPKVVGSVSASTLKKTYMVPYVSPLAPPASVAALKLTVPILLSFSPTDPKATPPDVKSVSAEIVVCTLRLRKYPIPIELTPDLCVSPAGSFDRVVVAPFAAYVAAYKQLAEQVPPARLALSPETVMDMKCLATLGFKTNPIKVPAVRAVGGLGLWQKSASSYTKQLDVAVDLASVFRDSRSEHDCLVPSFQTCILCRYYYLAVTVRLHSGEALALKVPVVVEN